MAFLVQCSQCGNYAGPGHCCPYPLTATSEGDGYRTPPAAEYQRRLRRHRINYLKYMVLVFAWVTLTVVIQFRVFVVERYWFPVETILSVCSTTLTEFFLGFAFDLLLVAAWLILTVGVRRCSAWWPIEVQCPQCSRRLDEMGMKLTHCPGCQVWLG
jgi:hypothetical protein